MSRYGRRLLKSINLQFCNHTPASRGVREYLEKHLLQFKEAHPRVHVNTTLKRNSFPLVRATYVHPQFAVRSNAGPKQQQQQQPPQQQLQQSQQSQQQQQQQEQSLPMTAAVRTALRELSQGCQRDPPDPTRATKTVDLKYKSLLEVQQHMWWLASGQGRPTKHTVPNKHWVSKQPSIQGPWTPCA